MSPYRNEIPHSVVTECKVYAAESVSVIEVGMTCPYTTEFDALCFVVAEQPTGRLFIEKKRVDLVPGTFVPVNPCQPGSCDEFRRVEGAHVVCIDPELLRDICLVLYNRPHLTFPNRMVEITPEIRALRQTFITEADRGPGSSSFLLGSCSSALAGYLVRSAASRLLGLEEAAPRRADIRNAVDYLNDHYQDECRLSDVAGAANLSLFHLIRVFKSETGKTPHEYLVDLRISKARQLLADRRFTIKEIAYQCGFQEPGSFSRVFQQRLGSPPRTYRKAVVGF